ncbi:hypothetical protein ACWPKO_05270 [Coraliomargarita sp. W4R53]
MISGFSKSCLIVAVDLALLWALPHVIDMRHELETLRAEHHSMAPLLARIDTTKDPLLARIDLSTSPLLARIQALDPTATAPRRPILMPIARTVVSPHSGPDDPFLTEARRRAEIDPAAAMSWLQSQHSGSERLRGMLEVVALWATEDSESALLWLESNAQGLARLETLNNGVELWAASNPTAAAEWIDGMANDGSKATAAKALAAKWAQSEPEAAANWVANLPDGPIRQEATQALADSWIQQDAKAASIWALSEAEFNGNYDLLNKSIREYSKQSPEDAESFVRDMQGANYSQIALASHVTGRAQQDPAATAKWLSAMQPDDPIYSPEYANSLMQVWAESDSIAASEWLSTQPQGKQRDAAAYGFSETIQRFEPEAAAAWANTIDDPDRRVLRLTDSIMQWARTKPHQALEWVKTAELEPAVRTHLANQIGAD